METFMESLNRVKEAHEKEVLGLQNKLLELNSERCRDAQRVEELFTKNHQLREQQKALKENLRVLENRLRAGLCDRCMVTQELARKKQLELESAHLQSLQHLCILTNEMNGLREENKTLKEEVKRLRSLGDKPAPQIQEGTSETPSPLPLPSPCGWKGTEKPPGGPEEAEEDQPGTGPQREEKPASHMTSPVARISPAANMPEPRALDMSPQCISNQLHATVAVVRPGSRACPPDSGSANGTPPPPSTRSSPPSPTYEHGLPLDSFLRASRASRPSTMAYETLKRSLQVDRLCLLNRHLSLRLRSPNTSPLAPSAAAHSPRPQSRKAGEAWDEPVGLPGTLVGMQDPRLEGALQLLLAQQQLRAWARAGSARPRGPSTSEAAPSSPKAGSDSESSENEAPRTALSTAAHPGEQNPQPKGPRSPWRKEMHVATQDCPPDKPLDLSDRGRSWDAPKSTSRPLSLSPTAVHTPSPQPPALLRLLTPSSWALSNGMEETRVPEPEEPSTPKDPSCTVPGPQASLPSPGRTAGEAGGRPKPGPHPQSPNTDGLPEPSKTRVQRPEVEELEKPATSDSEVDLRSEASVEPSMLGEQCAEEQLPGPQKRKRASDTEDKASKKPSQGGRKPKEVLTAAEGPRSPADTEGHSTAPSNSHQET